MSPSVRGRARAASWALVAALMSGCVAAPVREAPPVDAAVARAHQMAREAALAQRGQWGLAGRVALTNGERGGSGRLDWQQADDRYTVSLSAPITRQSWRLSGDAREALLEGLEGGPRRGADPAQLLLEATGWQIPVTALSSWLRGARAPDLGPAQVEFGADGRLARLEQGGWRIDYADWRLPGPDDPASPIQGSPGAQADALALPHRLEAVRGQARVRLVVDGWGPGAAIP